MQMPLSSNSTMSNLNFDTFDTEFDSRESCPWKFNDLRGAVKAASFGIGHALIPNRKQPMFRISTIDTAKERRLVVEGTLVKTLVPELRTSWKAAGMSLDGRKLVIDLTNATLIDAEGEAAIFDLMKEGAKFCCSDVLTKYMLKELAHKCRTRLRNVLTGQGPSNQGPYVKGEEQ